MKRIRLFLFGGFILLLCSGLAFGSALSEAAKKERERRARLKKKTYVLTNTDLKNLEGVVSQPGAEDVYKAQPTGAAPPGAQKIDLNTLTPEQLAKLPESVKRANRQPGQRLDRDGNGEAYWRQRISGAKKEVADLQGRINQLELDIPRLNTAFINTDDPAQRTVRQQELAAARQEIVKAKADLAKARAGLASVQSEGRSAGALPGWLR